MSTPEDGATTGATPLLLFFHSPKSRPCRRVESFLAQVLQHRRNHETFRLVRVDVDRDTELAGRLGVHEVPMLMVVTKEARRSLSEPKGRGEIVSLLEPWLK